ncbi:MAG: hypothetical protein JO029_01830 [Candidatus Eremiobacteraeota bacterium]|nr:hypothetical protein [Candidatus Eremiobacteraeota bacterium]
MRRVELLLSALLALPVAACGPSSPRVAPGGAVVPFYDRSASASPIRHVVIVMQENRSFDNVFAGFPGADAPMVGRLADGKIVPLRTITFNGYDVDHSYYASVQDYNNGRMDRFEFNGAGPKYKPAGLYAISHLNRKEVAPYWVMAKQYTLADAFFPTEHGASWTAHLNIIAGTTTITDTKALVDFPSHYPFDCLAPKGTYSYTIDKWGNYRGHGPFPCFTQFATMADSLDAAGLSWKFYAEGLSYAAGGGYWSAFAAIHRVRYGPDWKNIVSPPPRVLTDIAKGRLANVSWVTPEWQYSDHGGGGATMGPSWVSAIVNEIGHSRYWNDTAVVILWDEWGGFYDNKVPPQLDFRGLGIRVPCIIVSAYARPGYVSHTQYEDGSILKFVEQTFNLPALGPTSEGYTDSRASSIADSFDFARPPLTFRTIPAPVPASYFLRMRSSGRPPDDD